MACLCHGCSLMRLSVVYTEASAHACAPPAGAGVDNTESNRRDWREVLYSAPGLGQYISGCIMFEETLYQSAADGTPFVDVLRGQGIVPGIKVDTGLQARTHAHPDPIAPSRASSCAHAMTIGRRPSCAHAMATLRLCHPAAGTQLA